MSKIEEIFGPRCPDHDPDCAGCIVYGLIDRITELEEKIDHANVRVIELENVLMEYGDALDRSEEHTSELQSH